MLNVFIFQEYFFQSPYSDGAALTGLRGLASLHVAVFHILLASPCGLYIFATLQMPLFFLLSGFSLALAYGRTEWSGNTSCCNKQDKVLCSVLCTAMQGWKT